MLSSASQISELYEGLQGYILGGQKRGAPPPGAVPTSRPSDPRLPGRPGQQPANAKRPIPTSSQQPANRKPNQRVPYSRFMFSWSDDLAAPTDLQEGDVVFVHKTSQALGRGTSRMIKATGIPQLNAMMEKGSAGYATLSLDGDGVRKRIKELRILRARDRLQAYATEAAERDLRVEDYTPYSDQMAVLLNCKNLNPESLAVTDINPYEDWEAVTLLHDWTPDGVLIGAENEESDVEAPHDARNDGVLLNVAIAGPTPLRNSAWQIDKLPERNAWAPQIVDEGVLALDKVFVGLFVEEVRKPDKVGILIGWKYRYKLFSSRQILAMGIKDGSLDDGYYRLNYATPAMFASGPSEDEFRRLAAAWRIGSITDTRLARDPRRLVTLNVVIERWEIARMRNEFGQSIGNSLAPLVLGPLTPYTSAPPASVTIPAPVVPSERTTPTTPPAPDPSPGELQLQVKNTIDEAARKGLDKPYYDLIALNQYLSDVFEKDKKKLVVSELVEDWESMIEITNPSATEKTKNISTFWNALLVLPKEYDTYIEGKTGNPVKGFKLLDVNVATSQMWIGYARDIASVADLPDERALTSYEKQWLLVAKEYVNLFDEYEQLVSLKQSIMLDRNNKYRALLEV